VIANSPDACITWTGFGEKVMRGGKAWLGALAALAAPAAAEAEGAPPAPSDRAARAFVAGLIAEARAQGVFADASLAGRPRARHLASGVACDFVPGQPASIQLLPARNRGDNVGCTMGRGAGVLALQVQRIPAGVDAGRFLADMVEAVHADFPGASALDPPRDAPGDPPRDPSSDAPGDAPALSAAAFRAVFRGLPVYVEVCAVHAGPWMVSGHMVAPLKDAEASDRVTRAEVAAAAGEAGR
jgi:hypothetical protein